MWFLLACGGQVDQVAVDGKAVVNDFDIEFGVPVQGVFSHDLQHDVYTFEVLDGAKVKAEITRSGTSQYSHKMFLTDDLGDVLESDMDGWYPTVKYTFDEAGFYRIELSTANDRKAGNYRMVLSCLSDVCAPQPNPNLGFQEVDVGGLLWSAVDVPSGDYTRYRVVYLQIQSDRALTELDLPYLSEQTVGYATDRVSDFDTAVPYTGMSTFDQYQQDLINWQIDGGVANDITAGVRGTPWFVNNSHSFTCSDTNPDCTVDARTVFSSDLSEAFVIVRVFDPLGFQ